MLYCSTTCTGSTTSPKYLRNEGTLSLESEQICSMVYDPDHDETFDEARRADGEEEEDEPESEDEDEDSE